VIAASTSAASFGAYNSAWDGTAEVRDIAATYGESTVTLDGDAYTTEEPTQTLAVVLAPTAPYGSEDAGAVRRFVENGGTLLSPITLDQQKALLHTGMHSYQTLVPQHDLTVHCSVMSAITIDLLRSQLPNLWRSTHTRAVQPI